MILFCNTRYKDLHKKDDDFEKKLFDNLFLFVRLESMMEGCSDSDDYSVYGQQTRHYQDNIAQSVPRNDNTSSTTLSDLDPTVSSGDAIVAMGSTTTSSSKNEVDEREFLNACRDAGVVHILGNTVVLASRESRFYKRIAVDYIYAFLRKICREHSVIFNIPHESLLNVGQVFYV